MAAKNTLTTGIAELLILSILNEKDSYGYEINKVIQHKSKDMRFARLSKKILMVLSLSHITQHMLQPAR